MGSEWYRPWFEAYGGGRAPGIEFLKGAGAGIAKGISDEWEQMRKKAFQKQRLTSQEDLQRERLAQQERQFTTREERYGEQVKEDRAYRKQQAAWNKDYKERKMQMEKDFKNISVGLRKKGMDAALFRTIMNLQSKMDKASKDEKVKVDMAEAERMAVEDYDDMMEFWSVKQKGPKPNYKSFLSRYKTLAIKGQLPSKSVSEIIKEVMSGDPSALLGGAVAGAVGELNVPSSIEPGQEPQATGITPDQMKVKLKELIPGMADRIDQLSDEDLAKLYNERIGG